MECCRINYEIIYIHVRRYSGTLGSFGLYANLGVDRSQPSILWEDPTASKRTEKTKKNWKKSPFLPCPIISFARTKKTRLWPCVASLLLLPSPFSLTIFLHLAFLEPPASSPPFFLSLTIPGSTAKPYTTPIPLSYQFSWPNTMHCKAHLLLLLLSDHIPPTNSQPCPCPLNQTHPNQFTQATSSHTQAQPHIYNSSSTTFVSSLSTLILSAQTCTPPLSTQPEPVTPINPLVNQIASLVDLTYNLCPTHLCQTWAEGGILAVAVMWVGVGMRVLLNPWESCS